MPTKAELGADNKLLNKMLEAERDRANEWSKEVERTRGVNNELRYFVENDPVAKRKWNDIQRNKIMFQWFLEYLEKEKKTEAYRRIYKRAIKERLFDVTHPYTDSDPDKTIIDRIRRRLKNHCKRYKIPYPQ